MLILPAGQGIVETGGCAHIQKAGKLLEKIGRKTVIAVHLRPESAGKQCLHQQINGHGGRIGHQLEAVAFGQSGRLRHYSL